MTTHRASDGTELGSTPTGYLHLGACRTGRSPEADAGGADGHGGGWGPLPRRWFVAAIAEARSLCVLHYDVASSSSLA